MKHLAAIMLTLMLAVGLAGCTSNEPNNPSDPTETPTASTTPESSKQAVSVDDIEWSVAPGVIDGYDRIVFSYTNNSSYDVFGVQMEFRQAADVTDEQRVVFDELYESNSMWEDMNGGKDEVYITASGERYLQPGESNTAPCTFNSTATSVSTMEQYELMEPKMMSIAYKDGDRVYLEYYDFATDSYSSSSQSGKQAVTWSNSEIAQLIPQIEAPIVGVSSDSNDHFYAIAYGVPRDQYDAYVDELENRGFTVDANASGNYFSASNKEGVKVTANYSGTDESMNVSVTS